MRYEHDDEYSHPEPRSKGHNPSRWFGLPRDPETDAKISAALQAIDAQFLNPQKKEPGK